MPGIVCRINVAELFALILFPVFCVRQRLTALLYYCCPEGGGGNMSGILVIRLKGLGDIVHLLPVLRMLREQNPDEKLALLCQKPFGQIVPPDLKVRLFELPAHADVFQTFSLIQEIRREKFDRLFDLFGNPRTALISLFSGISNRFGFDYRIRRHAYTRTYVAENPNKHLMYLFADFFAFFGVTGEIKLPQIKFSEAAEEKALAAIPQQFQKLRPLLGINPHTTYPSKAWPEEYFVEFIKLWHARTGCPVMVTWGPCEREAAESIVARAGNDKAFVHEQVRIDEFASLLGRLDLFLTADTGPMNIAWAVNTPTIAMFGPTTREAVMPRGHKHLTLFASNVSCLQCHQETCSHKSCMYAMKPEWVLEKIAEKYDLSDPRRVK
jgi:ADP-heptose:LPS heptosyltransferase